MINGQSGAFEAFKNWWDHEDQEELRRSCAQGWAWKVWQARADLDSEQQPDVTQLVEALERFVEAWTDCQQQPVHAEEFEILTDICEDSLKALAAHRKGGKV